MSLPGFRGSSVDNPFLSAVKAETMLVRERRRAVLSLSTIIPTYALSLLLQVGLDSADHSLQSIHRKEGFKKEDIFHVLFDIFHVLFSFPVNFKESGRDIYARASVCLCVCLRVCV